MKLNELATLVQRLAIAESGQQADLLKECFEATLGPIKTSSRSGLQRYHDQWLAFDKKLRAEAFESTAMMLVPEGEGYELIHKIAAQTTGFATCDDKIERGDRHCISAKTPAMALAAAAVQAHAVRSFAHDPERVLFEIAEALELQ